jgi:dihydrofolate reductase
MGKLIVMNQITVNGAFESPSLDEWLVLDEDSADASLEQLLLADAMVLGRKTYEGLAAVWPQLADDPAMARFADRINSMPKYVASRTLTEPREWNAGLIDGEITQAVPGLKSEHRGNLIVSGCGELAHTLTRHGLVDEFWFWLNRSSGRRDRGSSTALVRCAWSSWLAGSSCLPAVGFPWGVLVLER